MNKQTGEHIGTQGVLTCAASQKLLHIQRP